MPGLPASGAENHLDIQFALEAETALGLRRQKSRLHHPQAHWQGGVREAVKPGSDFTNLHNFTSGGSGKIPPAGLILSGNTLFGTTGGTSDTGGTVFRANTDGSDFTNRYTFTNGIDGDAPDPGLIVSGSTLYGTTAGGGGSGTGTVFSINTDGSGFTNLHSFAAASGRNNGLTVNSDGASPAWGVTLSGNTLYGTTWEGGSSGSGTLFRINTNGSQFATLYSFTALGGLEANSDGAGPKGLLILSGNTLYGTASGGGSGGTGTVFALALPWPSLGIVPAGNQVVLSWPASAPNFVLQTATDLASGSWSNITNGIVSDGTNYFSTNAVTSQNAFFRLQPE